jgi:hypothetical protein
MRVRRLFLLLAQPELKRRKTITCSFVFFARVKMPRFVLFFFCCRRNCSQSIQLVLGLIVNTFLCLSIKLPFANWEYCD